MRLEGIAGEFVEMRDVVHGDSPRATDNGVAQHKGAEILAERVYVVLGANRSRYPAVTDCGQRIGTGLDRSALCWSTARPACPPVSSTRIDRPRPSRQGGSWCSARRGTGRALPPRPRPGHRTCRWRPPFLPGTGGMLVGPDDGGVHTEDPFDLTDGVVLDDHLVQDPLPDAVRGPHSQPLVGGLPRPVTLRQVTPRRAGPQFPQDRVDHLTVITPPTAPARHPQHGLDSRRCVARELHRRRGLRSRYHTVAGHWSAAQTYRKETTGYPYTESRCATSRGQRHRHSAEAGYCRHCWPTSRCRCSMST